MVADEMAFLPGMEELANLLYIVSYAEGGQYDVIVVDSAPTGETLRLLSFPEVLNWWMKRLFPVERQVARAVRPVLKPLLKLQTVHRTVNILTWCFVTLSLALKATGEQLIRLPSRKQLEI